MHCILFRNTQYSFLCQHSIGMRNWKISRRPCTMFCKSRYHALNTILPCVLAVQRLIHFRMVHCNSLFGFNLCKWSITIPWKCDLLVCISVSPQNCHKLNVINCTASLSRSRAYFYDFCYPANQTNLLENVQIIQAYLSIAINLQPFVAGSNTDKPKPWSSISS